jgi:outer membrane protein assembly factor BamD
LNRTRIIIAVLLTVLFAAEGCRHSRARAHVAVNPEFANLTREQIFERGEQWYAHRRYAKARTYYQNVYENYPNDPLGRRSLLRIADTYFMQGNAVNLVEAQYKYRDFINRYPGSENGDYAMLQIAMVSYKQMERPDRDQQKTREAVEKFQDMIRAYPRSPLRADADKRLQEAFDHLARHEQIVAAFYMKRRSFDAAVRRLNYLIDTYPNYPDRASVFYDLATSLERLGRKGEARLYYERVLTEFPKSTYADRARKRLTELKA